MKFFSLTKKVKKFIVYFPQDICISFYTPPLLLYLAGMYKYLNKAMGCVLLGENLQLSNKHMLLVKKNNNKIVE